MWGRSVVMTGVVLSGSLGFVNGAGGGGGHTSVMGPGEDMYGVRREEEGDGWWLTWFGVMGA
jgi:hypothetical protein